MLENVGSKVLNLQTGCTGPKTPGKEIGAYTKTMKHGGSLINTKEHKAFTKGGPP